MPHCPHCRDILNRLIIKNPDAGKGEYALYARPAVAIPDESSQFDDDYPTCPHCYEEVDLPMDIPLLQNWLRRR
jgi:hypothetical protein